MPLCSSSASLIWRPIVSTGLSEVIGSWKIIAMSLPRIRRISSSFSLSRSLPVEDDLALDDPARRRRDQAHQRERADALAAAGLADQAERLALVQRERHAVDGLDDAVRRVELRLEVLHLEQRLSLDCHRRDPPPYERSRASVGPAESWPVLPRPAQHGLPCRGGLVESSDRLIVRSLVDELGGVLGLLRDLPHHLRRTGPACPSSPPRSAPP